MLKAILALFTMITLSGYVAAAPVQNLDCLDKYWFEVTYDVSPLSNRTDVHEVKFLDDDCTAAVIYNIASYDSVAGAQNEAFNPFHKLLSQYDSNTSRLVDYSAFLEEKWTVELHFFEEGIEFIYFPKEEAPPIMARLTNKKPEYPKLEVAGLICDEKLKVLVSDKGEEFFLMVFEGCSQLTFHDSGSLMDRYEDEPHWEDNSNVFQSVGNNQFIYYPKNGDDKNITLSFPETQ